MEATLQTPVRHWYVTDAANPSGGWPWWLEQRQSGIVPPGLRTSVGWGSGLLAARTPVTVDGVALFAIDANCHRPVSRIGFAAPCHLAQ